MARVRRVLVPGAVYHVTARGNYRREIFFNETDRLWYLNLLQKRSLEIGLELLGWCLMPNHVHMLARERAEEAMARTVGRVHSAYATRVNQLAKQASGHLWQSRFYSAPVQSDRVWTVLRYIELNPRRAGICESADAYRWSSARFHLGLEAAPAALGLSEWSEVWTPQTWRQALRSGPSGEEEEAIRRATKIGRPWGSDAYIAECETSLGLALSQRKPGRPRVSGSYSIGHRGSD